MQTDYLIIGQGICGTFLSHYLLNAGKKVMVIDAYKANSASRVASGIINPVTGRTVVRTWMIEELLPFAQNAYEELGNELGETIAVNADMLTFHTTDQMSSAWHERIAEGETYLQNVSNHENYGKYFEITYGIGITSPCIIADVSRILSLWRNRLLIDGALTEEIFDINSCEIGIDGIRYKNIQAKKLILCNGISAFDNRFFSRLPFAFSKGEAIIARIPGLPATNIYKQTLNIVPIGDDLFWIGSSFDWEFEDDKPTTDFKKKVTTMLDSWLKLPYTIEDHKAAIRPGSLERRPFVGMHPQHPAIGILDGMGTKGCSLAPYFAHQLVQHLLYNVDIDPAADINRFGKLLKLR